MMTMNILTRISQHSAIQSVKSHYEQLSGRDQNLLAALGVFLVAVVFYLMVWEPLSAWSDQQMVDYRKQVETMEWLQQNADKIQALEKTTASVSHRDISTMVTNIARQSGVTIHRIQPDKKGVGVWLDDAAYQKVLAWIFTLENKYQIVVQQIKMDRLKEEGQVKGYIHFKN